jgi:hypothetical protein
MWVLLLNDMRSSNVETQFPVARAETLEQLHAFLAREKVQHWNDGRWGKSYRCGGPLEWFNPPYSHESFQNVRTEDDWAVAARERFRQQVLQLPDVGS